jgi:hypothetical protein
MPRVQIPVLPKKKKSDARGFVQVFPHFHCLQGRKERELSFYLESFSSLKIKKVEGS